MSPSNERESLNQHRYNFTVWSTFVAMGGVLYFAASVVALHFLRPEFNPITRVMSNYAVGTHGYIMTIAFFAIGIASLALTLSFRRNLQRSKKSRVGLILLGIWSVGWILAGIFPTDVNPRDEPVTTIGAVHVLLGVVSFVSVSAAAPLLSISLRGQTARSPEIISALAVLAAFTLFFPLIALDMRGASQRLFVTATLSWIFFMANRLRSE